MLIYVAPGKNRPIDLSRRQRYKIALILASSYVQLHPTPWLKSKWSKKDILFLYDNEDLETICIEQPYISRSLCRKLQAKDSAIPAIHTFQDSIRNLGIVSRRVNANSKTNIWQMLIELCFGTAIEAYKGRPKFGGSMDEQMVQVIDYAAADKWSRDVVGETGREYSDAVRVLLASNSALLTQVGL